MGEIADMMIDGTMCPCGQFIGDGEDGPGYQRFCSKQCERDYGGSEVAAELKPPKVACPTCGKKLEMVGLANHWRDKHGAGK